MTTMNSFLFLRTLNISPKKNWNEEAGSLLNGFHFMGQTPVKGQKTTEKGDSIRAAGASISPQYYFRFTFVSK